MEQFFLLKEAVLPATLQKCVVHFPVPAFCEGAPRTPQEPGNCTCPSWFPPAFTSDPLVLGPEDIKLHWPLT